LTVSFLNAGETLWEFFGETLHTNVLEEYYPRLLLHDQGQHITLGAGSGKTVNVSAWDKQNPVVELTVRPNYFDTDGTATTSAGAATTVDEHQSPDPITMEMLSFNGTIQGFGGSFGFTDIHMTISEIVDTLTSGARQLGGGYAQVTEDNTLKILLDALDSTTTQQSAKLLGANGKAGTDTDPVITAGSTRDYMRISDLYRVTTEFDSDPNGEALRFSDGTVHGILHPRVSHDLFTQIDANQPNLVDWLQTTRGQGMFEGRRLPIIGGVMLDTSARNTTDPLQSHGPYTGANWHVSWENSALNNNPFTAATTTLDTGGYLNLFFVPGAFANIDLASATPSLIMQPFGSSGAVSDSLKRFMSVGIKGFQTAIPTLMSTRSIFMAAAATTL